MPAVPAGLPRWLRELDAPRFVLDVGVALLKRADAGLRRQCGEAAAALRQLLPATDLARSGAPTALLLLLPLLLGAARASHSADSYAFALASFALAVSSERLYVASEALAGHCDGVWKAAVYGIFSNGALVIYVGLAVKRGSLRLAQLALLGSVLFNAMAVLGGALLAAGLRQRQARFSTLEASALSTLLLLAVAGVVTPTLLGLTSGDACAPGALSCPGVLAASRAIAAVLLASYGAWLLFAHSTHTHLFAPAPDAAAAPAADAAAHSEQLTPRSALAASVLVGGLCAGLCVPAIAALEGSAARQLGVSRAFMGGVAVPLALNAGELAAALQQANRGACTAAVAVALRSAVQIALCVLPSAVLGAAMKRVPLDLHVTALEAGAVTLGVLIAALAVKGGSADWLHGVVLLTAYVLIAAAFDASHAL